jgi:hypothetical protein
MLSFQREKLSEGETLRNFTVISAIVCMAFAPLIAGCGGGDDAGQIDKATFASRADRICKQVSGKMAAEVTTLTSQEKAGVTAAETQIALAKEIFIPGLEEELRELRALGVPDEAARQTQALFQAYQRAIDIAEQKPRELIVGASPYEPVEFIGTKLGISDCPVAAVLGQN